jgi:ribosomal protein S18 acetylase RimI-like enzyme
VYRELGDYRTIIPSWLDHPGVQTFVDVGDGDAPRGFILVGFYLPEAISSQTYIADLLAIAVAPEHQGQGVGRGLLGHAIEVARSARDSACVPEIRLTVSEHNAIARGMFERAGFRLMDKDYGTYDRGQRAFRMARGFDDER